MMLSLDYFHKSIVLLAVMVMSLAASQRVNAQPMIVKDGKAAATIVIAEQPQRSTRVAARELQRFIKQMTGAVLPIATAPGASDAATIYVGQSDYTKKLGLTVDGFSADGFRMVTKSNSLILIGNDANYEPIEPYAHTTQDQQRVMQEWDALTGRLWNNPMLSHPRMYSPALDMWALDGRGSINAVVHFLRSLGVRWYFPGNVGQVIPKVTNIALPGEVDQTLTPDFSVRSMFIYYAEFFEARGESPRIDDVRWNLWLGLRNKNQADEWGFSGGHGLVAATARPEVREKHPEYYALWGGKRAFETSRYGAQCLSSPGLAQEIVDYARVMYDHYKVDMISTGPGDSFLSACQCELCEGKATPERGWRGQLSDYAWSNTERIARELYKTHPDKWVGNLSYSTYTLPPLSIETFSPNVAVTFCRARGLSSDPVRKKEFRDMVSQWLEKLPSKRAYLWEYYLYSRPGHKYEGVPVLFPRVAADDLSYLKNKVRGEYIEVYGNREDPKRPWHELATMHLNCYVTARLWWDADLNINELLDEYYQLYYGPAHAQMKEYIDYAEANWLEMPNDHTLIDGAFERLDKAVAAVPQDSIYRQRIDMIVAYTDRMHQLRDRLARGRDGNPQVRVLGRNSKMQLTLDGKLDDEFWKGVPVHGLSVLTTGAEPAYPTRFQLAWRDDALYLAVQCTDVPGRTIKAAGQSLDDSNLWNGDVVELMLETQVRSYYQIAIGPTGAVVDLDRTSGFGMEWTSNIEVVTKINNDGWTLEARLPIVHSAQADVDPGNGVAGIKPNPTYPWFFNLGRQRKGEHGNETSAFSPTGTTSFHDSMKFGQIIVP